MDFFFFFYETFLAPSSFARAVLTAERENLESLTNSVIVKPAFEPLFKILSSLPSIKSLFFNIIHNVVYNFINNTINNIIFPLKPDGKILINLLKIYPEFEIMYLSKKLNTDLVNFIISIFHQQLY